MIEPIRRYRSVFLSDIHLGARACRADALLAFLEGIDCERLYLLGDIVDGWSLARRWFWPPSHAAVLERLLQMARCGVAVTYVPGNHDAFARDWCGRHAAGIAIQTEAVHVGADGTRRLLVHGDAYDPSAGAGPLTHMARDLVYRALLRLDVAWRRGARWIGAPPASLAAWLKRRSGVARRVVADFEAALAAEAARRGFDGVICGHIHSAASHDVDGVAYANCGDWVESFTAAAEAFDGRLEVLRWRPAAAPRRMAAPVPTAAPQPVWNA